MPRIKTLVRNDHTSTTSPTDPDAIPAFETSAGIPKRALGHNAKPVYVNKYALADFNKNVDPAIQRRQVEAANVASLFAKNAVRPDEIAAVTRRGFEVFAQGMEDASLVMTGVKKWDSAQMRIFSLLAERFMPKVSAMKPIAQSVNRELEELTLEELENLALGKAKHLAVDAVMKQGQELAEREDRQESANATRKLKKITKHIASIDEAVKAYSAKPPAKPPKVKKN